MPRLDGSIYNIYIATCRPKSGPIHWTLLLSHPGSVMCTWYHVAGGPSTGKPYRFNIRETQRLNSPDFLEKIWISGIMADRADEVEEIAESVMLQDSRSWVYELVVGLERRGLVPKGMGVKYLN